MRLTSASISILLLAASTGCITRPVVTEETPTTTETTAAGDRIMRSGEWKWVIKYRAKGTRSEGQHGVLYFHRLEITDGKVDELRDTPFGTLKYYGKDTGGQPWVPTGWNYADSELIRASWQEEGAGTEER